MSRKPHRLIACIALLVSVPLWTGTAQGDDSEPQKPTYGGFRLVKSAPSSPSTPEITLPEGYEFVKGRQYRVASRAEYYAYLQGPSNPSVEVTVRWKGEAIAAVIGGKNRIPFTRDLNDPYTIRFPLYVGAGSPAASRNTLEVWSLPPTDPGVFLRIEHNDPDRAAGDYASQPWVGRQAAAAINQLYAAQAILQNSGLAAKAASRGHFYALLGFETNNLLHPDFPAHWHFAYYQGKTFAAKAYLPHLLLDERGRNLKNGQNVTGEGRTEYEVGQPAELRDPEGIPVAILTVRSDGGLDVRIGPDGSVYSIVGGPSESFNQSVSVLRDGTPWLQVSATDSPKAGKLVVNTLTLQPTPHAMNVSYDYDPLTGVIATVSGSGDGPVVKSGQQNPPDRGTPPLD